MTTVVLEIRGLDELLERLGDKSLVADALVEALDKSVKTLQARAARYPPSPSGYRMEFVSSKQRRYFFWALRTGRIRVPYRRTGTLGRKITTRVDRGTLTGRVGLKLGYGPYVIGDEKQARIHKGRWYTWTGIAREKLPEIKGYFAVAARVITVRLAGQ